MIAAARFRRPPRSIAASEPVRRQAARELGQRQVALTAAVAAAQPRRARGSMAEIRYAVPGPQSNLPRRQAKGRRRMHSSWTHLAQASQTHPTRSVF